MPSERDATWHVFGLANCDSCRKARKWLSERQVPHVFHDLRETELSARQLRAWLDSDSGAQLLNRRSTTWRQLTDAEKRASESDPLPLLRRYPTLIKRPVITRGGAAVAIGFSATQLEALL